MQYMGHTVDVVENIHFIVVDHSLKDVSDDTHHCCILSVSFAENKLNGLQYLRREYTLSHMFGVKAENK